MIKYYQKRYTLCSYLRRRSMSQKYKRVFLIVLDSVGMGNAADAADYGDKGANTFGHIWEFNNGLQIPNMLKLGWGNIQGVMEGRLASPEPLGCFGKMAEASK